MARLLGRGGNGAVYLAEDARLGRLCVVKELQLPHGSSAERRRAEADFAREARILAQLSTEHPGLPQTYDFFAESGRQYLVMQYVAGMDLDGRLRTGGPLAESEAVGYGAAVAEVLAFLHAQQPEPVIHRDVKPSNLIVDAQGRVKLVDFGLAKALPSTTTMLRAGAISETGAAGTAGYTPLEQWALQAEARSDVYALGATLHHLLTGRDPRVVFEGHGELNLELIRRLSSFPRLRTLRADVSPALDRLLAAMLASEPAGRPAAHEVQATLAGLLKPGRTRVSPRPARPAPAADPNTLLAVPLLPREVLGQAAVGWMRAAIVNLPEHEPVEFLSATVSMVPLALGAYHIAARFDEPSGRPLHELDARGVSLADGATGAVLDASLAAYVAAQRTALTSVPMPGPEVAVTPFRQDAARLRDALLAGLSSQYTRQVNYVARNGRRYTRTCKPARKDIAFDGGAPLLLHHPLWSLRLGVRGQVHTVTAYQGAPRSGGPPFYVVAGDVTGGEFCSGCGSLFAPGAMTACAECGRRMCGRCIVHRSRLAIFHKPFCSDACARAFAARQPMLRWI
ncbi:MAG TPA: protein kinase [Chloroflexia bacterium]|nr:protein kinase [Chloroflexia bacterium]